MNGIVMQFNFKFILTLFNCKSMIVIFFQVTWTKDASLQHFVIEVDDLFNSFIVVTHYPYHGTHLHCLLSSTIRQMNTVEM
jgi:hypothetical protein